MAFRGDPVDDAPPLVGREAEVRLVREVIREVRQGEGRVVQLLGEPGIGKTRLLGALRKVAGEEGVVAAQLSAADPQCAVELRRLADAQLAPESPDTDQAPHPLVPNLPAVVLVDDGERADPETVELLGRLTAGGLSSVLCVVAHRERQAPAGLRHLMARGSTAGTVLPVELGPLTANECAELAGRPLSPRAAASLRHDSRGNPLYLLTLTRLRTEDGDRSRRQAPGSNALRPLQDLLVGELIGLSPDEREVLHTCAVLGDTVRPDVLAQIHPDLAGIRLLNALDELTRRDLLRVANTGSDLTFRHPLVRRAIYEQIPPSWRLIAHGQVLSVLRAAGSGPVELAPHLVVAVSADPVSDAATLCQAAAESEPSSPLRAAGFYEAAIKLLPSSEDNASRRFEIGIGQARALARAGRIVDSRDLLQELLRWPGAERMEGRTTAVTLYALNERRLGRALHACGLLRAEISALTGQDPAARLKLTLELGRSSLLAGQYRQSRRELAWARAEAQRLGHRLHEATALALTACGEAMSGRVRAARAAADAAVPLVDALPDAHLARLGALQVLAWGELLLERVSDARHHLSRLEAFLEREDDGLAMSEVLIGQTMVHLFTGALRTALELVGKARNACRDTGHHGLRTLVLTLESRIAAWLDLDCARPATAPDGGSPTADEGWTSLFTAFRDHTELGHLHRRAEALLRPGRPGAGPVARSLMPQYIESLVSGLVELGDVELARTLAQFSVEFAESLDLDGQRAHAARAMGWVHAATGRHDLALGQLEQAEAWFFRAGKELERAQCLVSVARILTHVGRRDDALTALPRAEACAAAIGANPLQEEAARLRTMIRSGPRRARALVGRTPSESLTEREQEVAAMAGEGWTNRRIARQLHLSERTVETHLANVYRKLGGVSREALAHLRDRGA